MLRVFLTLIICGVCSPSVGMSNLKQWGPNDTSYDKIEPYSRTSETFEPSKGTYNYPFDVKVLQGSTVNKGKFYFDVTEKTFYCEIVE